MSFDFRFTLGETFDVPVPPVPLAAIRERGIRASARETTRWRVLVAAIALTSAFTLTLACAHYAPVHATPPLVSSTPAPTVT